MQKQDAEKSTREKIINCAFDLFARKGIEKTSMREIAQDAGLTKPVIYYYFKDKDELCFEIIRNFIEMNERKILEFTKENPELDKFLENIFVDCLHKAKDKKILCFVMHLHSYISGHPEIKNELKKLISHRSGILEGFLKQKIKEGRLAENMFDTAVHIIFANTLYMMHAAKEHSIKFKDDHPKEMAKAILRAVCYKGESR
ncbi:MAG: TetR/AcrR family transcriptional regulator [Elusimicrobiota bacterium]|jgi:AcrR family transcriptional regulator|nr:TetR/AcrR family transcriptional regulator [Elusimicrobiota bacterium]